MREKQIKRQNAKGRNQKSCCPSRVEVARAWDRRLVELCFRAVATPAQMRRFAERIIRIADEAEVEACRCHAGAKVGKSA